MAVAKIAHKPDLTNEQAMGIFQTHFAGKYEVVRTPWALSSDEGPPLYDFVVRKNGFVGVGVRLVQAEGQTSFVHGGCVPGAFAGLVVGGTLVPLLFIHLFWRDLEHEVSSFIASASEFK